MAERGVHFALTPEPDARVLAAAKTDAVADDAEGAADEARAAIFTVDC